MNSKFYSNENNDELSKNSDLVHDEQHEISKIAKSKNTNIGIKTGFDSLDSITCGSQRKNLIILGGHPGMGKTKFAINLARNISNRNYSVAYFSLESSANELIKRIFCCIGKISFEDVMSGKLDDEQMENLFASSKILSNRQLTVCDEAALTISDLKNRCKWLKDSIGLDVVIIDYLQLLLCDQDDILTRKDAIDYFLRSLKEIAKELNITIIALSQFNHSDESDDKPQILTLWEPNSVKRYVDILFLVNTTNSKSDNDAIDIVAVKNKDNEINTISLKFDRSSFSFSELE